MENLSDIILEVKSVESIVQRLTQPDWINDPLQMLTLIEDLTALFVAYNTNTFEGSDFQLLTECIQSLLEPLLKEGFVDDKTIWINNRPFIFISPNSELINALACDPNYIAPKNTPVFHGHIDTVRASSKGAYQTKKNVGQLPVNFYGESQTEILLKGLGVVDMKSQIAAMITSLYLLKHRNQKPKDFVFFISSDEEDPNEIPLSRTLHEKFALATLKIDLEPTGSHTAVVRDIQGGLHPSSTIQLFSPEEIAQMQKAIKTTNEMLSQDPVNPNLQVKLTQLFSTYYLLDLSPCYNLEIYKKVLELVMRNNGSSNALPTLPALPPNTFSSSMSKTVYHELTSIYSKHFGDPVYSVPLNEFRLTDSVVAHQDKSVILSGRYATALTLTAKNYSTDHSASSIAILSYPERGSRHTSAEAVVSQHTAMLARVIYDILINDLAELEA